MERSMTPCQKNDATTKTVFCEIERAREKTGDILTNIPIPLENRNSSMLGS